MADRKLRYPFLWLGFVVVMLVGAGLFLSDDPVRRWVGLVMLGAPLIVLGALALAYYLVERKSAT